LADRFFDWKDIRNEVKDGMLDDEYKADTTNTYQKTNELAIIRGFYTVEVISKEKDKDGCIYPK